MKWRNQLLALLCLIAFAGLGVLYFQHWVVQRSFGIILIIGEGLAPERIALTRGYLGGADNRLSVDSMPQVASVKNYARDFAVPDQAAAATALATGVKVNNRSLSIDANGKALPTIVELARERGRAIGLISDKNLTNPTCAAFYTHSNNAGDTEQIAQQFVEGGKIDIGLGSSAAEFLPETKHGHRQDHRDLLLELRGNGFDVVRSHADLEAIPAWRRPKLFGAFGDNESARDPNQNWNDEPSLSDAVRRAIELLQYNQRGYVLVVDAARMREAAEADDAENALKQTAEFDRAVATAHRYAGGRSTIIVCGDVAIGGLHANGFPFRKDSGIALLGLNSAGQPWLTWATGPKGTQSYGAAKLPENEREASVGAGTQKEQSQPAAFYAPSALPTVEDVVAFGSGRGAEALHGTIDNTDIFKILRDEL
ncbi:MAG TPA: alkaline phosphatase [Chthoniobacterales bacterium]|nr:alkaline phosphatase [Chthoniobacterales bacterium]